MKKTSFDYMWELLSPSPQYADRKEACRALWESRSIDWQRQRYWFIRELKRHGEAIKDNPLFALQDCNPQPTNWNGKAGVNEKMKSGEKMVIACYEGRFGIFTLYEALLFNLTDVKPLNF